MSYSDCVKPKQKFIHNYMKNIDLVIDILSHNNVKYQLDESLKNHTSVKVGGNAKIFATPNSQKQLVDMVDKFEQNEIKYQILGNGTNSLFLDKGFDGVIVCTKNLKKHKNSNNSIYVQCGLGLFDFCKLLKKYELGGLEFLFGIPGSVGGAIVMNAGAFEQNIGDHVEYVLVYCDGKVKKISKKQMQFSYRESIAQKQKMIVLGAKFKLQKTSYKQIDNKQKEYFQIKTMSQPYDKLSFGSAFKKSNGKAVSKMIDELGLKGFRIGNVEISKKHAGFIINIGDATCQDFLKMIKYIEQKIFENYGLKIEPEVKLLE